MSSASESNNIATWSDVTVSRNTNVTSEITNRSKVNTTLKQVVISFNVKTSSAISSTGTALATIEYNYRLDVPVPVLIYYPSGATSYKGYISTDGGIKNSEALPNNAVLHVYAMYMKS